MRKSKSRPGAIRKLLARGIDYEREGRKEWAEECYRSALKVNPRCGEALRLQGLLALQAQRYRESIGLISAALALEPDDPAMLSGLAASYLGEGEKEPALRYYRRVVELRPQSAEAQVELGEAEKLFGELEAAAECYRRALELEPDSAEATCKLGDVLRRLHDLPEALRLCQRALALDPERAETYRDLGVVLTDMKNVEGAAEALQHSLELKPDSGQTALTLSYFHFKRGDLEAAANWARRAVELDPKLHLAHLSLGSILTQSGAWAEAFEHYQRAKALCPNSADVNFYLGLLHLSHGNFALGWPLYEDRDDARRVRRIHHQRQWRGEPLAGARIFLHAEQGAGDTLQAVRYVPLVAARGGEVVLAVQPRLYRLLARTEGASRVITDGGTVSDFHWQCPLLSLPLAFGTDLSSIPAKIPYVFANPALVQAWGQRMAALGERRCNIGLAWGGDPKHVHELRRAIPLELLAPLTTLPGATFYSLQMGAPAGQLKQLGSRVNMIDLQEGQSDFADAAAIVANLDLVISIDTSLAHLAGAMGKPVWVLLHKAPDWRWLLEREDSPWYPTARLFRQSTLGDWQEVVARVERELRELVARSSTATLGCVPAFTRRLTAQARVPVPPLSLTPRVRQLLKEGIGHQQAGRLAPAEACYCEILEAGPRCPQALHLLGLLAQQRGQFQESIRLIGEALELTPDDADTLNSLADSYIGSGEVQAAGRCLQRLAELLPQSAETHHRLGKTQEATGNWAEALQSYQRALALKPDSPDLHSSLATLQYKQGALEDVVETCRRALVLDPNRSEIHSQLGNALTDLGKYGAAVEAHQRALALKPDSAVAIFGLGYFFERKGEFASAAAAFRNALKFNSGLAGAHLHLGIINILDGKLGEAEECFQRVLKLSPDTAEARFFLGLIHLAQGNFALGWSEYEARRGTPQFLRDRREFAQPLWKGEPLQGSRILLYGEQGLGDTVQFVRYVPLVAARGGKVWLEVPARLHRLLAGTPGAAQVIRHGEAPPQFDWQCPLMSLPWALGTELSTIPADIPYICPDPAQAEAWRVRLAGRDSAVSPAGERGAGPLRVGLAWGGSALHPHNSLRSIPLAQLAPLLRLEGVTFYSLQMGEPAGQARQLGLEHRLIDLQDEQKDLADAAAIVANLDLVISIDTSVAHLAGAMGKPVWVLLCSSADWRWLLEREDSPWYPSARLFRQSTMGNWQDVVARVEGELRQLVASVAVAA